MAFEYLNSILHGVKQGKKHIEFEKRTFPKSKHGHFDDAKLKKPKQNKKIAIFTRMHYCVTFD